MKIAFVNPPDRNTVIEFPDDKGDSFLEADDYGYFPPLGLLYVLSYLEKTAPEHQLYFLDCPSEQMSHEALRLRLQEIQPDLVGLTSFTVSLVDVALAAKTAKEVNPSAHVCMGGHHAIAYPHEAASLPNIDSIVVGEGEHAFTELVRSLADGLDITTIPGVYTAESLRTTAAAKKDKRFLNSVIVTPAYVSDIEHLPFPNRRYMKHIRYQSIVGVTANLTTILSSRGCPYLCTFCNVPYKQYRERTPASVVDEMEECLALGYEEFHFYDDLFNITPKKVIELCDEIDRRNLKVVWDFRGRVNGIDRESLVRAKKSGCRMISFGVETGSDEGLKVLRKGTNVRKVLEAFKLCRELGIVTIADYMIGLPHERTRADVMRNIDFLIDDLDPDYAQFNILTLYPHTEAYDQAVAKGIVDPGRWNAFAMNPTKNFQVDHWTEHLPLSALVELYKLAYRKFYFRPRYIARSLTRIKTPHEFMAKFRGALKLVG